MTTDGDSTLEQKKVMKLNTALVKKAPKGLNGDSLVDKVYVYGIAQGYVQEST